MKFPFANEPPLFGATSFDDATILVEQSLSTFGDPDAIFLASCGDKKYAFFIEAKVAGRKNPKRERNNLTNRFFTISSKISQTGWTLILNTEKIKPYLHQICLHNYSTNNNSSSTISTPLKTASLLAVGHRETAERAGAILSFAVRGT